MWTLPAVRLAQVDTGDTCPVHYWLAVLCWGLPLIVAGFCQHGCACEVRHHTAYVYSVCGLLYGAVTGSPAMTYFETSAMLFSFVLLGKYLESLAKGKTSEAIGKLLELAPTTAILLTVDSGT